MAEVYEADNNSEMAMDSYQRAADMFANDNKKSNASQCLLKVRFFSSFFRFFKKNLQFSFQFFSFCFQVAVMASEKGELVRAADIFESIGMESMQSNLGKLVFTPENSKQSRQKWVSEFENVRQASSLRRVTSCSACCAIWRRETPCRRRPRCPAARTRTTPSGPPESAASWRSCWRLGHPTSPTTALLLHRIVFTFCFSFCGTF